MPMFCSSCGAALADQAAFCSTCGTRVDPRSEAHGRDCATLVEPQTTEKLGQWVSFIGQIIARHSAESMYRATGVICPTTVMARE
jgi:predicted amidophosphoribosyltransferase